MRSKHFQLVAVCAVLLHLADSLLVSWGHSHGPADAHHSCHQVAEHATHHHHGSCPSHSHAEIEESEGSKHSSLPRHDDADHCAACRHLAQAAAHQFVLTALPTVEKVAPLCGTLDLAELGRPAHAYQSRGPPTAAL